MKKLLFLTLGLLAAIIVPRTNGDDIRVNEIQASPELARGIWSSSVRTKGGLGSQWKFTEEGEATCSFGALVDFRYEIDGNQIKMILLDPDLTPTVKEEIQEFLIDDKTLILEPNSSTCRQVMTRVGATSAGTHPIVGAWTYSHITGPTAVMRYFQNGICQLSVPFQELKGTYGVDGNDVSIVLSGKNPIKAAFLPSEDILTLTENDREQRRYIRYQ